MLKTLKLLLCPQCQTIQLCLIPTPRLGFWTMLVVLKLPFANAIGFYTNVIGHK